MLIRRRWTRKPPDGVQIDWTHPLARKLIFFTKMDRIGSQWDLVQNRDGPEYYAGVFTEVTRQYHKAGTFGPCIQQNMAAATDEGGWNFGDHENWKPTDQISIIARVHHDDTPGTGGARVVSKRLVGLGDDDWAIYKDSVVATEMVYRCNDETTPSLPGDVSIVATTSLANSTLDVAMSVEAGVGIDAYLWNLTAGEEYESLGNTAPTDISSGTGPLIVGAREDERRSWDGQIEYVAIWHRTMTKAEIESFRQNPWQIFQPREIWLPPPAPDVGFFPVKLPWRQQPPTGVQIDRSNRIGRLVRWALVPAEARVFEAVSQQFIDYTTPANATYKKSDKGRVAGNSANDTDGWDVPTELEGPYGSDDRLFAGLFRFNEVDGGVNDKTICSYGNNATGERWTFKIAGATGALRVEIQGDGTTISGEVSADVWHTLGCGLLGSQIGDHTIYIDGVPESATGTSSVNTVDGGAQRIFGDPTALGGLGIDADFALAVMFDSGEQWVYDEFYRNPWQIFKPRTIDFPAQLVAPTSPPPPPPPPPPEPTQAFQVIRGTAVMSSASTTLTITEGVDYTLPDGADATNCFIRIANTRKTGMGATSGGGTQNLDDFTCYISNPGNIATSITFERTGSATDCRVTWEILCYIGADGGDNEMIVRDVGVATGQTSITGTTVTTISDNSDVVVFITGQKTDYIDNNNWHGALYTASLVANGGDWDPQFDRISTETGTDSDISYAVVEFTGANWTVDRVQSDTEVSTWGTGDNVSGTIAHGVTIADVAKACIIESQYSTDNDSTGLDDAGDASYLDDATNIRLWNSSLGGTRRKVWWILQNSQADADANNFNCQRVEYSDNSTGAEEYSLVVDLTTDPASGSASAVADIAETSIVATGSSAGTGTALPRGCVNYQLTGVNEITFTESDSGQPRRIAVEIIEWPEDPAAAVVANLAGSLLMMGVGY